MHTKGLAHSQPNLLKTILPPPNTLWNKSALHAFLNIPSEGDLLTCSDRPLQDWTQRRKGLCDLAIVILTVLREGTPLGAFCQACALLLPPLSGREPSSPVTHASLATNWVFACLSSTVCRFTIWIDPLRALQFCTKFWEITWIFILLPQGPTQRRALSEVAHTSKGCKPSSGMCLVLFSFNLLDLYLPVK